MPRPRNHRRRLPDFDAGLADLELAIGPIRNGGYSVEDLRAAWELRADLILEREPAGSRPWAFWVFEVGEEVPRGGAGNETIRLAQLGLLSADERAGIAERAHQAKLRLGTTSERHNGFPGDGPDAKAVELWDAIKSLVT